MRDWSTVVANRSGSFPDVLAINSSGASSPDGTEFIAAYINNGIFGPTQALMDYAGLTPDGVTEAAGVSQLLEAIRLGHGIGPGKYVQWGLNDDPSVTGDRVLLLSEQGVNIVTYADLDSVAWIGGNTAAQIAAEAAGEKFYRSSDAGGTTGDAAGPYLQLPPQPHPTFFKTYSEANGDFTISGPAGYVTRDSEITVFRVGTLWHGLIRLTLDMTATSSSSINITGVTFPGTASNSQAIPCQAVVSTVQDCRAMANGGTNTISFAGTSTFSRFALAGIVIFASQPTFADNFNIPWGITY